MNMSWHQPAVVGRGGGGGGGRARGGSGSTDSASARQHEERHEEDARPAIKEFDRRAVEGRPRIETSGVGCDRSSQLPRGRVLESRGRA